MNNDYLSQIDALEQEFTQEIKGYGSLSVNLVGDSADDKEYLGYDVRPEDIEALYFEGIGTPRWESIEGESVDEKMEIYNRSMKEKMAEYPQIGRVSDTDVRVEYSPAEVSALQAECDKLLEFISDEKAVKAARKFAIACRKASEKQTGVILLPS